MASERIPQGGGLTVYDPGLAAQGFFRDPIATGKYYAGVGQQAFTNMQTNLGQKTAQVAQQRGALFPRSAMLGGALGAAPGVIGTVEGVRDLSEGRLLEGGVTLGGSIASSAAGAQVGKRLGGVRGALIGSAISGVGSLVSSGLGGAAERKKAEDSGRPIAGQEGSASEQRGRTRKDAELALELQKRSMDQNMQFLTQYTGMMLNAQTEQLKKEMPLIQQLKDRDLARQQALINTQGQNYAMLGTMATMGKLSTGAQQQAGANLRTAMTSNPYANSVLQAPSISFG